MKKFRVKYFYLASGMEGHPDQTDYGIISASSPEEACKKVASIYDEFDWMMAYLSAKEVEP